MIPLPPPTRKKKSHLWRRLCGLGTGPLVCEAARLLCSPLPSAGAENMEYYFVNSQTMNRCGKKSNLPVLRIRIQKNCQKALKNMVLGSGIRKKPIPDPGSRIQGSKSTQSRIPDPGSGSATLLFTMFFIAYNLTTLF